MRNTRFKTSHPANARQFGRLLFLVSLMILLGAALSDSQGTIRGRGSFQLDVDVARFYGDSTQTYVELYYDILENILAYKPDSGRFIGAVNIRLEVRKDSAIVTKKEWTVPHTIDDTSRLIAGQKLVGIEGFGLPSGSYSFSISAYDVADPSRRDSLTAPLPLPEFSRERESFSDVEFCTSIQQSTNKQSMYYKNTLEVVPNASRLYGIGLPIIYYYTELYNLIQGRSSADLDIHSAAIDAAGREVVSHDKPKSRLHNSSVEVGTLNISSLRGGTYIFRISLLDSAKNTLAFTAKKFFVYRPGVPADSNAQFAAMDVSTSEYVVMGDSALDREFACAKYVASDLEQQQYKTLTDVPAKRKFLFEFWRRRDIDPMTPTNEYKEEYFHRIDYAVRNLTVGQREGWKTDRGRVYIVYGPADEVERFPSSGESLPYEIWHYNNLQGGVIFVFVDRTGMGEYEQVHSTHRDELHDESWYDRYAQRMH
ncbi:MAG TPA: GWxTD domain-containing protein [Bacteroidota bacterium]